MKRIILLMILSFNGFAQGGPNGPPNPACFGPNPPPWCNNPPVPIDNWQLMLALLLTGITLGFIQYRNRIKPKQR
jgi:hypothetical protein